MQSPLFSGCPRYAEPSVVPGGVLLAVCGYHVTAGCPSVRQLTSGTHPGLPLSLSYSGYRNLTFYTWNLMKQ